MSSEGKVDIVYLIDTSSSMSCLKADLDKIVVMEDHILQADVARLKKVSVRSRVCGFRLSLSADSLVVQENPFTVNRTELLTQIHQIEFGDAPATPRPLLDAILKLSRVPEETGEVPTMSIAWRPKVSARRLVIVLTDSACQMVTCSKDDGVASFDDVAREVISARLRLAIFAPEHDCYHTIWAIDRCEVVFAEGLAEIFKACQSIWLIPGMIGQFFRAESVN